MKLQCKSLTDNNSSIKDPFLTGKLHELNQRKIGNSSHNILEDFKKFRHENQSYVDSLLQNEKLIGEGNYGKVFKVFHPTLEITCAVKVMDMKHEHMQDKETKYVYIPIDTMSIKSSAYWRRSILLETFIPQYGLFRLS